MRSKDNLKKFPHVAKTKNQQRVYQERLSGSTSDDSALEEDFKETTSPEGKPADAEETPERRKPFKSWKVKLQEHSLQILGVIVLGLSSWLLISAVNNGRDISSLRENYGNLKEDVTALQGKYENINEKSIRSEVLLEEIQKDLNVIGQRLNISTQGR